MHAHQPQLVLTRMPGLPRHALLELRPPRCRLAIFWPQRHPQIQLPPVENQLANLLGRISEWFQLFVKPAEQLERSCKWGVMLRRIFADFGGFVFQPDPRKGALAAVKCGF
jgi:hypothetical protein